MALRASSCALEIPLPGVHIARLQIGGIYSLPSPGTFAATGAAEDGVLLRMNKCHKALNLFIGLLKRRHTLVGPATSRYRSDLVSIRVLGDQLRPRKVGTAFAASGVPPMAERAILPED